MNFNSTEGFRLSLPFQIRERVPVPGSSVVIRDSPCAPNENVWFDKNEPRVREQSDRDSSSDSIFYYLLESKEGTESLRLPFFM